MKCWGVSFRDPPSWATIFWNLTSLSGPVDEGGDWGEPLDAIFDGQHLVSDLKICHGFHTGWGLDCGILGKASYSSGTTNRDGSGANGTGSDSRSNTGSNTGSNTSKWGSCETGTWWWWWEWGSILQWGGLLVGGGSEVNRSLQRSLGNVGVALFKNTSVLELIKSLLLAESLA
jgi:hypothetical protein